MKSISKDLNLVLIRKLRCWIIVRLIPHNITKPNFRFNPKTYLTQFTSWGRKSNSAQAVEQNVCTNPSNSTSDLNVSDSYKLIPSDRYLYCCSAVVLLLGAASSSSPYTPTAPFLLLIPLSLATHIPSSSDICAIHASIADEFIFRNVDQSSIYQKTLSWVLRRGMNINDELFEYLNEGCSELKF